ncbi:MAG: 4-hydroxy-tetrahydrodipicolinate reductase [Christensenellales bacterium]|jgi:4-hydroxy-tetrahydrodipicolinate reductase
MRRLIISGACGRMGRWVADQSKAFNFDVVCGIDPNGEKYADFPIYKSFDDVPHKADVLIDFSLPAAFSALSKYIEENNIPSVLCATGYDESQENTIKLLSQKTAIFRSRNMSMGVFVLEQLSKYAKKLLNGYDVEIIEWHHNKKADSPSGTALSLYEAIKDDDNRLVMGRNESSGKREPKDIGMHSLRGGSVTGKHEISFFGDGESISISHNAENRGIFAQGALKAAGFLLNKPAGLYSMNDYFNDIKNA